LTNDEHEEEQAAPKHTGQRFFVTCHPGTQKLQDMVAGQDSNRPCCHGTLELWSTCWKLIICAD
jgi:hypothetical protein